MRSTANWACCAVLAAACFQGGGLASQEAVAPETQKPTFRVEASYVRVDVYATDKGVPVRNLTKEDFEVFEDGARQQVDQFEYVIVPGAGPQAERREPNTVAESRAMARETRGRVFVLFLDTYHTSVAGSQRMRTALNTLLDRILGPDDLVGVMTPDMSSRDVTFARRTDTIASMLSNDWMWGRRDRPTQLDPEEEAYIACYGPANASGASPAASSITGVSIAAEMIERRREKLTFDAMTDLVTSLRDLREERKAVLVVSDGWRLFRPNDQLGRSGSDPSLPGLGVGPTGGLTTDVARAQSGSSRTQCETDRVMLAGLDNDAEFRRLLDRANRSNVTFYPIDSRGLPVFDTPMGGVLGQPTGPPTPAVDQAQLRDRIEVLRNLAAATDGIAVINSNDIERNLERIAADLSGYYLLGYYSTNTALDGRFRSLRVRINRPGITVRARRGYLAATPEEMRAPTKTTAAPIAPGTLQLNRALSGLAGLRPDARVRTSVAWIRSGGGSDGRVWAALDFDRALLRTREWAAGGRVEATLSSAAGARLSAATIDLAPGQRSATIDLAHVTLPDGEVLLRLRITPASGGLPLSEAARFIVDTAPLPIGSPQFWRRGPLTGPQFVLTGDLAFRRNEILRLDLPVAVAFDKAAVELLDRTGRPMNLPVATKLRGPDGDLWWATADVSLAPLAEGDYVLRVTLTSGSNTAVTVAAFRMVP